MSEDEMMETESKVSPMFKCNFDSCTRVFKRKDRLDTHKRVHTGERPFICNVEGCSRSYTRSQHLSRHFEKHHTLKTEISTTVRCPTCKKELLNTITLEKHIKSEHELNGPTPYECPEPDCSEKFHKKRQLVSHRLKEHTDHILEARKCHRCPHEDCDKTFPWANLLRRHMKIHKGYTCNFEGCDQVLANWSLLRKHKAQAHGSVHTCEHCGKNFSRRPNLVQHMKRKHREGQQPTFTCPVADCGRVYNYNSNLKQHIRESHEGEDIWRNRPRHRASKVAKKISSKKISLAAKLCGLDDRSEILKYAQARGSKTPERSLSSSVQDVPKDDVDANGCKEISTTDGLDPLEGALGKSGRSKSPKVWDEESPSMVKDVLRDNHTFEESPSVVKDVPLDNHNFEESPPDGQSTVQLYPRMNSFELLYKEMDMPMVMSNDDTLITDSEMRKGRDLNHLFTELTAVIEHERSPVLVQSLTFPETSPS